MGPYAFSRHSQVDTAVFAKGGGEQHVILGRPPPLSNSADGVAYERTVSVARTVRPAPGAIHNALYELSA